MRLRVVRNQGLRQPAPLRFLPFERGVVCSSVHRSCELQRWPGLDDPLKIRNTGRQITANGHARAIGGTELSASGGPEPALGHRSCGRSLTRKTSMRAERIAFSENRLHPA